MNTGPSAPATPRDARSRARPELTWYLRHAESLARWPVIEEAWARRVEEARREGTTIGTDPPHRPQ